MQKKPNKNEVGLFITTMYKTFLSKKAHVSDLYPSNILVQKKDSKSDISLMLVDGIGDSDLLKSAITQILL